MGGYLPKPKTEKSVEDSQVGRLRFATCAMQGWRIHMEDAHVVGSLGEDCCFFGVFDGHGGPQVSRFVAHNVVSHIRADPNFATGRYENALKAAYLSLDELLTKEEAQRQLQYFSFDSRAPHGRIPPIASDSCASSPLTSQCVTPKSTDTDVQAAPRGVLSDMGVDPTEEMVSSRLQRMRRAAFSPVRALVASTYSYMASIGFLAPPSPTARPTGQGGNLQQKQLALFAGCTAISAILTDAMIFVANAGDSRCVLCRSGTAIELSRDHKPQMPDEEERILSAGGYLEMGRVNGNLNLSRAIGDLKYKLDPALPPERQIVTCSPELLILDRNPLDEFLLLACDGVWETRTSQEVVDFIRQKLTTTHEDTNLSSILGALFDEVISPSPTQSEGGCDNMTAIIIDLRILKPRDPVTATAGETSQSPSSNPEQPFPTLESFASSDASD